MTMNVRIKNESQQYVARVENHDVNPADNVTTISTAGVLKPGEEIVVYATSTRSIHVIEEAL